MKPARLPGAILRPATREDVAGIQRVRHAVKENRLVSRVIADAEVIEAIETTGRGWVVEAGGKVVAFAIGNAVDGSVWALFVDPLHEGCGYGRRLHDVMVEWLHARGFARLWLTTDPGTRAEDFYARAGWVSRGRQANGELRFEHEAD